MKLLIISDTHGYVNPIINTIKDNYKFDALIHLGDYVEDGIEIGKALGIPATIVRGNGDFNRDDFKDDETIEIGGKRFFLTHGHKYGVNFNLTNLLYKGEEVEADYILFGHIHVAILDKIQNVTIMNPGSPVYPRGYSRKNTFGIINIGENPSEKIVEIK